MQSCEKMQDRNESCDCPAAILDSAFPATRFPQCPCYLQLLKCYTPLRPCFWFTQRCAEFGGSPGGLVVDRHINPLTALSGKRRYRGRHSFFLPQHGKHLLLNTNSNTTSKAWSQMEQLADGASSSILTSPRRKRQVLE